jgi:hypothetical protein
MLGWCDCLDDDHLPATTWARQPQNTGRLFVIIDGVAFIVLLVRCFGSEQLPDSRDIGRAVAIPIEPIMSDAVLASGQDVDQEPADELGRCQRHGGVAARAFKTVVLDLEGDVVVVHVDQTTVGNSPPSHGLLCKPLPVSGVCSATDTPARPPLMHVNMHCRAVDGVRRRFLWRRV